MYYFNQRETNYNFRCWQLYTPIKSTSSYCSRPLTATHFQISSLFRVLRSPRHPYEHTIETRKDPENFVKKNNNRITHYTPLKHCLESYALTNISLCKCATPRLKTMIRTRFAHVHGTWTWKQRLTIISGVSFRCNHLLLSPQNHEQICFHICNPRGLLCAHCQGGDSRCHRV